MRKQHIVIAIVSLFTVSIAHAQYYYQPPPGAPPPPPGPPPGYVVPPPPQAPPPNSWFWAPAPSGQGPYFRAGIGPSFYQNGNLKGYSFASAPGLVGLTGPSGKVTYNVGVSGYAAFGFAFNRYVGLDFQTGYTWAQLDNVQNYSQNNSSIGNIPFLANLTLSLPIPHSNIIPYIGGGVGGADSIFDARDFFPTAQAAGINTIQGSRNDVVFAWQAFAGVRFQLDPSISLGVGYNFFMTGNPTFSYPPSPNLNAEFEGIRAHTIMFTLQANF
jgi:opacity protein-like surface antigen